MGNTLTLEKPMKKIGLLGGTFDPIHFGHINLAFELMEKHQLDQVCFLPDKINPHKLNSTPTPFQDRLNMLKIALEGISAFYVDDIEGCLPSPSYTLNTLQVLLKEDKGANQFFLLLGEDSIPGFFKWHKAEEIVQLVPLLIGSRTGTWEWNTASISLEIKEAILKGLTKTSLMDISGTYLRERIARGLYCGHLIPAGVLKYIQQEAIYNSLYAPRAAFPLSQSLEDESSKRG